MAFKLIYNGKKLIESGELKEALERAGFKTGELEGKLFITTKAGNVSISTQRNTKVMAGNAELSAFLKKNNYLDKFLQANKEIFGNDDVDSFELVIEFVKEHKDNILVVGESIYIYNGKYYELFDFKTLGLECYKIMREVSIPTENQVEKASYFVYNEFLVAGRHYDMRRDYSYKKKVKLVFLDGTLEITRDGINFLKDSFNKEDNQFFMFNLEYLKLEESNGIVKKWFDVRFFRDFDRSVCVAGIGDLFVTNSFSQSMLYLYGAGGTGKSLLQESFSSLLSNGSTSTVNINDLGNQFKTAPLFRSVINFSSEISRKAVSADKFKSIIARDEETLAIKFKNDSKGRPLAKWLSVANSLPTIEMDSGVKRRLLAIEVTDIKIHEHNGEHVNKSAFEQLFFGDKRGMLDIIIEGILQLMNNGFDLQTYYNDMVGDTYIKVVENLNDSISHFLDYAVEKRTDLGKDVGILKTDLFLAFEAFRKTPEGTGISNMKSQTFYARVKENGNYKDKRTKYMKHGEEGYHNSKFYYPNAWFKKEFIDETIDDVKLQPYKIDDLRANSNIETQKKLDEVKQQEAQDNQATKSNPLKPNKN